MPDANTNIERLFVKVDSIAEAIMDIKKEVGITASKLDDFSYRLRKLEERDEKHLAREEKMEVLVAKLETIVEKSEDAMSDLEQRLTILEDDVTKIKNNWGWVAAIVAALGGIGGFIVNVALHFIRIGG